MMYLRKLLRMDNEDKSNEDGRNDAADELCGEMDRMKLENAGKEKFTRRVPEEALFRSY